MQQNLVHLFKSKGSVANCMTDRASFHTGNDTDQFLHFNERYGSIKCIPEGPPPPGNLGRG